MTMATMQDEQTRKSPADRLLMELKMRGPQSSVALGSRLGITGEAARQQLLRLEEQGFVTSVSQVRGVGRPMAMWQLTDAAQRRFPDTHAQLTVDILATMRSELGQEAVDAVIQAREHATRTAYHEALAACTTVAERVAGLADIRAREGYMAEWSAEADGSYLLVENHCPICAAAATCQEFCRAELSVFQDVLGNDVSVEREEHILAGARRCAYRISPHAGRVQS